jgi:GYF domain 2
VATRWFYRQGGKEYGPVSAALLTQLADVGRLEPTDLVWAENTNQRMPASRIKGLFASAQPQEPPRSAAASEHAASKPRAKSRPLLWLGGSGVVVVLIAVALFAGWYMGQRDQNRRVTDNVPQMPAKPSAEAPPKTEWAIVTDAMKECRTGKELFDDADDPSTPSTVRKAREAQEHLEHAKNMVIGLPKELQ